MLAFHIDNLLFLLLIGMAALLRLLASKAGETKKKSEEPRERSKPPPLPSNQPIERAPEQRDADRIRKFLEALGQPTTSRPPPPVLPRTDVPPRPLAPVRPPPGMFPIPVGTVLTPEERRKRGVILHEGAPTTPQVVLPKRAYREEIAPPPTTRKVFTPVSEPPITQVGESATPTGSPFIEKSAQSYVITGQPKTEPLAGTVNIISLLQSPSGLRNAIILREIFGPPRSLQPLELIGSAL